MYTISCYGAYIDFKFVQNELLIKKNILPFELFKFDFSHSLEVAGKKKNPCLKLHNHKSM